VNWDIASKRFVIFGLQGSGKTCLAKYILKSEPAHLVYDVLDEYRGFNRYIATYRQYTPEGLDELNLCIQRVVIGSGKVRLFILDEANRYCPNGRPLPNAVSELNDFQRHYRIAFGAVARRPAQLATDLTELAHYIFVFRLRGKNDLAYLDALSAGLGDAVAGLTGHQFVLVDPGRHYQVQEPVIM